VWGKGKNPSPVSPYEGETSIPRKNYKVINGFPLARE
jgi:hypothetical protein